MNLFEMSGALIHRLLDNKWRINKHLSYYRYTIQFFIFFALIGNIFWKGDHSHLSAGGYLPVNTGMTASNVFLNMSVNGSYQMGELFNLSLIHISEPTR